MRGAASLAILLPALSGSVARSAPCQGVTTAAITGIVRDERGIPIAAAQVEVVNHSNGFVLRTMSRDDGRYVASGLDVGGPYAVAARRIGYMRSVRDSLYVTIGQTLRMDLALVPQAVTLQAVTARARADAEQTSHPALGIGTLISDSLMHRLPISDRDLFSLLRLTPQMSSSYGLSASGASPRVNAVLVDGVGDQGLYGNVPAGGIWGGKSISIEAVKQYQVLLSPFDVRYGNFAGALINAVTRSGTSALHGGVFYYGRYQTLSRNVPLMRDAEFGRAQAGFTLGGPLVKSGATFFVAAEFQQMVYPTFGPYVGQRADATPPLRVDLDTLTRFQSALARVGLVGGSAGAVTGRNPLANIFARADIALPRMNSRLVLRENFSRADSGAFSRPSPAPTGNCRSIICFALSSAARRHFLWKDGTVAQLFTTLSGGIANELIVGRLTNVGRITPVLRQPLVIVQLGASRTAGQTLQAGSYEVAHGDETDNKSAEVTDNFTLPLGSHSLTIGANAQIFRIRRYDLRGAFGIWTFQSITALEQGSAQSYKVARDFGGARVTVPGGQYALYAGDQWDVTPRFSMTYGLRADIPVLTARPPYSKKVDSVLALRTDHVPSGHPQWSPRVGFSAELPDDQTRVTGGVGVFMGRPAMSWIVNGYQYYGMPRSLSCGASDGVPPFSPDPLNPPLTCASGRGFSLDTVGAVNLLDPKLKFPQNVRGALTIERRLPSDVTARIEGEYTHALHELFFVNRNLPVPTRTDAHGRLMYGSLNPTGTSTPVFAKAGLFGVDVIELTNQSKDYSYSVTSELEKRFAANLSATVSLTYGRAYDVQSHRLSRNPATDNWRLGRTVAGRQDVATLGVSDFDQPYRVVANGTYSFHVRNWTTDVSLYYFGSSGFPFTYLAGGDGTTGDLNADGTSFNDPIYIPRDANDTTEIVFDPAGGSSQQTAFESFIEGASCLRRQRGRIMQRNSCRTPWTNMLNVSLRESFTGRRGHPIALELQVFNALNLMNRRWGLIRTPGGSSGATSQINLLTHTGQNAASQSVFRFDTATRRFDASNLDSFYQIQLGVRYSF